MRVVIQRVLEASVSINNEIYSSIKNGLLVLIGIEDADDTQDIEWLSKKIVSLRIFNDTEKKMNFSVQDVKGEILVVSQFTLFASTKKGNRPSYIKSAKPEIAVPIYEQFIQQINRDLGKPIKTGQFGADMQIALINDGPVTLLMDSKSKE